MISLAALIFTAYHAGNVLSGPLLACLSKENAIAVVKLDHDKGLEAAKEFFNDPKNECDIVVASGQTVGKSVFRASAKRGDKTVYIDVVEILGDTNEPLAYFMTLQYKSDAKDS